MAQEIYFKDKGHVQRFLEALRTYNKAYEDGTIDWCYGAALYIFTADAHTWDITKQWTHEDHIEFREMLGTIDLTAGTDVLLHLAWNLFNNGEFAGPVEFTRLDQWNYKVAMQAIDIRCHGLQVKALE